MLKLNNQTPRDTLNKQLSKTSIIGSNLERFKTALDTLLRVNPSESEEHQKNEIKEFLAHSFGYKINTKGRIDYAIYDDKDVKVIIEAKKLDNKTEMTQPNELNRKALHEAILYFMQERKAGNDKLTNIIIANVFEWFVFDARDFEKLFWLDKDFKKRFLDFDDGKLLRSDTPYFYDEIAKPFVTNLKKDLVNDMEIDGVYFDLRKVNSDSDLNALFKLLSPEHLLGKFNPNDANSLNRAFYNEFLYILGLEEVKDGGKKLISRAKTPQGGSLYENIKHKLGHQEKSDEFETIVSILIVWINRILFLKLLESQIYRFNGNDAKYKFLNIEKIEDFDDLESLFFDVLAKPINARESKEFDYIPYLNSSLFERHELEKSYLYISNLRDGLTIKYFSQTVLKDKNTNKRTGEVETLQYLFEFLDAYNFASEGTEEVVSDNKALINASVLGLIFEKLNGYKDGSFYTPSFITMYMARESITKAVLSKFRESHGIEADDIESLNSALIRHRVSEAEADKIISSVTICDPAVGSGHFLVSALNELIYIKHQLGLFGFRNLSIDIENDELFVRLDGEFHEYKKPKDLNTETHKLQKRLFEEKQRIIENQLFGVDINPNSVNITRLRLWIELLKHTFYRTDGTLETLPNIDINIKSGNSLISRFDLKDELKIKNIKREIEQYKQVVSDYKENIGSKKEVLRSIENLKDKFRLTLKAEWKVATTLNAKLKEFVSEYGTDELDDTLLLIAMKNRYGQTASLFGDEPDQKKKVKLLKELTDLQAKCDEIESGKIYENAFEWRFEFPEILDDNGDFVGFDVVIGNPPYGVEFDEKSKKLFGSTYKTAEYQLEIYSLFMEKASEILLKGGQLNFIVPSTWLNQHYYLALRKFMVEKFAFDKLFLFRFPVFSEATVESSIFIGQLVNTDDNIAKYVTVETQQQFDDAVFQSIEQKTWANSPENGFNLAFDASYLEKIQTIEKGSIKLENIADIFNGIKPYETGKGVPKQTSEDVKNRIYDATSKLDESYKQYIVGTNIQKFAITPDETKWIKYGQNLAAPRNFDFSQTKIVVRQTSDIIMAAVDCEGFLDFNNVHNIVLKDTKQISYEALVAILNSSLMDMYYSYLVPEKGRVFAEVKGVNLRKLPIKLPDAKTEKKLKELYIKIANLKKSGGDTSNLENQIDQMVYGLYGLSEDEIATVEGL